MPSKLLYLLLGRTGAGACPRVGALQLPSTSKATVSGRSMCHPSQVLSLKKQALMSPPWVPTLLLPVPWKLGPTTGLTP